MEHGEDVGMKKMAGIILALALLFGVSAQAATYTNMRQTAVAYMEIKFECGCTRVGLGTMVAPNGMVTAAHNVICSKHNQQLETCNFYFGYYSKNDCFYKYNGSFSYTWYSDFSNGYKSADDIAFVKFPTNIGNTTGWYASSVESDSDLEWEHCYAKGYRNGQAVNDWGLISVVNDKQIKWTRSESFQGACEGGPLYYDYEGLEYPVLVAVYTSFAGDTGYARRLTGNIIKDMRDAGVAFK